MDAVRPIAEVFLLSLALGVGIFTVLIDSQKTGVGLLKVVFGICMSSLGLGFLLHLGDVPLINSQTILYASGFLLFVLSYFLHRDKKNLLSWTLYGAQNIILLYLLFHFVEALPGNEIWGLFSFFLLSILFLGVITFAMVLGHWYLVVPKLSEEPLKKSLYILWGLLVVRVIYSAVAIGNGQEYFVEGSQLGAGYLFNWILLFLRLGWGYFIILVLSIFTWKLVKIRSIQSATGLLYVMTIFVFVGELSSSFLYFKYGLLL